MPFNPDYTQRRHLERQLIHIAYEARKLLEDHKAALVFFEGVMKQQALLGTGLRAGPMSDEREYNEEYVNVPNHSIVSWSRTLLALNAFKSTLDISEKNAREKLMGRFEVLTTEANDLFRRSTLSSLNKFAQEGAFVMRVLSQAVREDCGDEGGERAAFAQAVLLLDGIIRTAESVIPEFCTYSGQTVPARKRASDTESA